MKMHFGLDFGTTNSALAINKNNEVKVLKIDPLNLNGSTLRSVIYFDNDKNIFVGEAAIVNYLENDAVGRFLQSIKSYLPDKNFDGTTIFGKKRSLEELIAIVLKEIKKNGENLTGQEIENVLLGRPVFFSDNPKIDRMAENRLRAAAKLAGFKEVHLQLEPIAAGLIFEKSIQDDKERIVLVGDFGGGTSDFTIMKLGRLSAERIERRKDILSLGGVYIAGDSFDSAIMQGRIVKWFGSEANYRVSPSGQWHKMPSWIINLLSQWHTMLFLRDRKIRTFLAEIKMTTDNPAGIKNLISLIEDNYGFMLFHEIERAKIELSIKNRTLIRFCEKDLSIEEILDKDEFEQIIAEKISQIEHCVNETLLSAGLSVKDIDFIFLTGGSSFIPRIKKIFIDKFGYEKLRQGDAFTSVAAGLAVGSSLFFK